MIPAPAMTMDQKYAPSKREKVRKIIAISSEALYMARPQKKTIQTRADTLLQSNPRVIPAPGLSQLPEPTQSSETITVDIRRS